MLIFLAAFLVEGLDLASEIEDAGIATLGDLPLELELKVAETVGEDDVSAGIALGLSTTGAGEFHGSVLYCPASGHSVTAIASPAGEVLAVENLIIPVFVKREASEVYLGSIYLGEGDFFAIHGLCYARDSHGLTDELYFVCGLFVAACCYCEKGCSCPKCFFHIFV
jgi:hypothetical protein